VYFDQQSFAIYVMLPTPFLITFLLTRQVIDFQRFRILQRIKR